MKFTDLHGAGQRRRATTDPTFTSTTINALAALSPCSDMRVLVSTAALKRALYSVRPFPHECIDCPMHALPFTRPRLNGTCSNMLFQCLPVAWRCTSRSSSRKIQLESEKFDRRTSGNASLACSWTKPAPCFRRHGARAIRCDFARPGRKTRMPRRQEACSAGFRPSQSKIRLSRPVPVPSVSVPPGDCAGSRTAGSGTDARRGGD